MSRYFRHLREFETAVGDMTAAMDGMHKEHSKLKKQFRTYLADHEAFTQNVRRYLDELEIDDDAPEEAASAPVAKGLNDNAKTDEITAKTGGK